MFIRNTHTGLHENTTGSRYLGTRATHYDGELSGIAQALGESREVNMLVILTDSKPAISTIKKLDSGTAPPRSEIEAQILNELCRRSQNQLDTGLTWVKGHKGIEGNEKADKLCRETSILGHVSEGVVTPAGLRAWSRKVRAEARGGSGEGILGWKRKAISAYTWCVTEKGPQGKGLHKIKKKDTPECRCHRDQPQPDQLGEHLVEGCRLLAEARELVEESEMREWRTRHSRAQPKEKKEEGPVEPGKKEEEEDKLETFFCQLYEFHNPPVPVPVSVELPPRYAISFVPAAPAVISPGVIPVPALVVSDSVPSTDYSVISSVNFVVSDPTHPVIPSSPPACIETN